MEVSGKVKVIIDESNEKYPKKHLIIETSEQYPQTISVEFAKDKISLLNSLKVGDSVTACINLKGREWVNPQGVPKYFNSIEGWKIK